MTAIRQGRHVRARGERRGRDANARNPAALRRPGRVGRALRSLGHRIWFSTGTIAFLLILAGAGLSAAVLMWPEAVPRGSIAPLAVIAGLLLGPRMLLFVYAVTAAMTAIVLDMVPGRADAGMLTMLVVVMLLMYWVSRTRAQVGAHGIGGERMLVDLRDRLRLMGEMPRLPRGWHAETALESAHGDAFSGDFMVTARSEDGGTLEIVVVDVSGKGLRAGTRSLLLSGAFSGLLGSTDAEGFLPAANSYLLRQSWPEGFATAIHVQICLRTGFYTVASAGHPPLVTYSAGSGRWSVIDDAGGPLLGVLNTAKFPRTSGVIKRGDALLLYTDGVIESRNRHLADGIDRMLGTAERNVKSGFTGMASRICNAARSGESDDRAVVLVWRG